jgi:hypothetical protein
MVPAFGSDGKRNFVTIQMTGTYLEQSLSELKCRSSLKGLWQQIEACSPNIYLFSPGYSP